MFKKTLLALTAGGAIAIAALAGSPGMAQAADTSVHSGIGVPGVELVHSRHRRDCWLPERYLCGGPIYGRPVYGRPVYGRPVYGRPVYGWPGYYGGHWRPPVYYGRSRHW
jgi:hypothetical protein